MGVLRRSRDHCFVESTSNKTDISQGGISNASFIGQFVVYSTVATWFQATFGLGGGGGTAIF